GAIFCEMSSMATRPAGGLTNGTMLIAPAFTRSMIEPSAVPVRFCRRRMAPTALLARLMGAENSRLGTRLAAVVALTVLGLARIRACRGIVRVRSLGALAGTKRSA